SRGGCATLPSRLRHRRRFGGASGRRQVHERIHSRAQARREVSQAPPHRFDLGRRAVAEVVGTALLLATGVGSGVVGGRLGGGNAAVALLANTLATGAALVALILTFGPISGAHFNPAVTLADAWQGGIAWRDVLPYIGAQVIGAFVGV